MKRRCHKCYESCEDINATLALYLLNILFE